MPFPSRTMVATASAACLLGGLGLAVFVDSYRASNCGGNAEALSCCGNLRQQMAYQFYLSDPAEGESLPVEALLNKVGKETLLTFIDSGMAGHCEYSFVPQARLFGDAPRNVVLVCDEAFDNIPEPRVWNLYHRNPAHAAVFANGSSGLISEAEYQRLRTNGLTNLRGWLAQPESSNRLAE